MLDSYVKKTLQAVKVSSIPGITPLRVGNPKGDGGYVIAEEAYTPHADLFSFGIGYETTFEYAMSSRFRSVMMFDIKPCELKQKTTNMFFCPLPFSEGALRSFRIPMHSMLKVDVEGAEWDVLEMCLEKGTLDNFSQIVAEFHLFSVHYEKRTHHHSPYFSALFREFYDKVNEKLFHQYYRVLSMLHQEFFCFHVHANNSLPYSRVGNFQFPPLVELSFVRKTDVCSKGVMDSRKYFPIMDVDVPNKSDRPDFRDVYPLYKEGEIC